MRSADPARDAAALWDIATPPRPRRLPGVTMAGFRERGADFVDLRVVPFPAVTIAIDFGGGMVIDDTRGRRWRGSVVVGVVPDGVHVRGRAIEGLQLRLSPALARAALGVSADASSEVIALDAVLGPDARRVEEQLRAAVTWADRFAIAETAIARRLEAGPTVDPEVSYAWNALVASRGMRRIEHLAAEVGWSRKRLWTRFRSEIGLTPKRAAQLIRFDHAAHRLAAGESPARVAADSGYADQSHLNRDVMAFAGLTPTAVAAAPWLAVDDVAWSAADYTVAF